jgi:outer membrane protein OmpA-like peptidoglycan-associated protein
MKQKILFLVILLACLQFVNAQTADSKFAIGVTLGKTVYSGDYGGNAIFDFGHTDPQLAYGYLSGGLSFGYYLTPSFDLGLQGNYGTYGRWNDVVYNFLLNKFESSFYLHYKFNNGYLLKENSKLAPFLSLGYGLAFYNRNNNLDYGLSPRGDYSRLDFIVPVGLGLKYQFDDNFALQYQYLYNFTTNDNHDTHLALNNPVENSRPGNDAFGEHIVSLIVNFGGDKDSDHDGVSDKYDLCPDTPKGVKVDSKGCPIDSDNDGVPDYLDKCPDTPANAKIDANGCPLDTDGDGVPDYLDKCPNTPKGVAVDANGCPFDADKDGVPDYLDKCPDTPVGVAVDAKGCPLDSDGDGVPDYMDKCPNTPNGVAVDKNGCPLDRDGDGVPDYLDKCPDVPGTVANKGCPEVTAEHKKVFEQALQGIQFETAKDVIKKPSYIILNKVVDILKENPSYNIEINGHTDNQGNVAKNLDLSQKRSDAVKKYLVDGGINASRLTTKGFGATMPVADNATAAGRAKNRRVEFKVNF